VPGLLQLVRERPDPVGEPLYVVVEQNFAHPSLLKY
jgi:hypothetical protein